MDGVTELGDVIELRAATGPDEHAVLDQAAVADMLRPGKVGAELRPYLLPRRAEESTTAQSDHPGQRGCREERAGDGLGVKVTPTSLRFVCRTR